VHARPLTCFRICCLRVDWLRQVVHLTKNVGELRRPNEQPQNPPPSFSLLKVLHRPRFSTPYSTQCHNDNMFLAIYARSTTFHSALHRLQLWLWLTGCIQTLTAATHGVRVDLDLHRSRAYSALNNIASRHAAHPHQHLACSISEKRGEAFPNRVGYSASVTP
jgi:hypothetical protein